MVNFPNPRSLPNPTSQFRLSQPVLPEPPYEPGLPPRPSPTGGAVQALKAPLLQLGMYPYAVDLDTREYQTEGAKWLWDKKKGMLTDAPGLGKTPQAALASEPPVLICCPNYLVGQWGDWLTAHFPTLRTVVVKGDRFEKQDLLDEAAQIVQKDNPLGPAHFTVINQEMLHNHKQLLTEYAELGAWTTVIFDESHHLKNRNSERGKTAVDIARFCERVYLLTATPIWKEVDDLYNQLRICQPTVFTSYHDFVNLYCIADESRWGTRVLGVKKDMIPELDTLLGYMRLGRSYKDVGRELPPVISSDIVIDFDEKTRGMYDEVLNNFRLQLELLDAGLTPEGIAEYNKANQMKTTSLYQMQKVTEEPSYQDVLERGYDPEDHGDTDESSAMLTLESYSAMMHTLRQLTSWHGKIDAVCDAIYDTYSYHQGRVVVFTWYRDAASKICEELNKRAVRDGAKPAVLITGNVTDPDERRQLASGSTMVVATLSALSEGVDLSWGRMVVFAEEHYSPGSHVQAMARVVRDRSALSQDNSEPVLVNYVMTRDTIDQTIHNKSQQRGATIKEIIHEAVGLL